METNYSTDILLIVQFYKISLFMCSEECPAGGDGEPNNKEQHVDQPNQQHGGAGQPQGGK